jgi:hypothetical protein
MKTLTDGYNEYIAAVYPKGLSPTKLKHERKGFFAGSMLTFRFLMDIGGNPEAMQKLFAEAEEICRSEIQIKQKPPESTNVAI